jgi:hypothetical protein
MKGPDGQQWMVVAVGHGEAEASILAGRLDSAEIPTWTYRESAGSVIAVSFGELGNVYVLVPEEFYEQANEMLALDDSTLLESGDDLMGDFDIEDDEEDEPDIED